MQTWKTGRTTMSRAVLIDIFGPPQNQHVAPLFFWFYVFIYASNIALFVHSNPWLLYPTHILSHG